MRSTSSRAAIVLSLAAVPLVVSSTLAWAADSTVGETFATSNPCATDYTILATASIAPSYALPSDGVITSVRMTGETNTTAVRAFRLGRGSGVTYTIVGSATPVSIPQNQTSSQAVRIPARTGDVLGFYDGSNGIVTNCDKVTGAGDTVSFFSGDLTVGTTSDASTQIGSRRLPVSATVEPDADGDGYGDTTQDQCATSAVLHTACNSLGKPSGKAKVGKRLRAPSVALPTGFTESFQWYRTFKKKGHRVVVKAIGGATAATYKAKRKDRGKKLFVRISASAPGAPTTSSDSGTKKVH